MTALANVTAIHSGVIVQRGAVAAHTTAFAPRPVSASLRPVSASLRLTRRGRMVFGGLATVLVAGVLAIVAVIAAPGALASEEQGTQAFPYVLAQSGDSLWSIASELDPSGDTRDVIAEIVRLNQLPSSGLQAGEAIAVPIRFEGSDRAFPASELGR